MRPPIHVLLAPALLTVAACAAAKPAPSAPKPLADRPRLASAASTRPADDAPATSRGRTVLRDADTIVRGRLTRLMPVGRAAEVGRLAPTEWLRGAPDDEGPLTVLSGQSGVLPAVGRDGIFLLRRIPTSSNWDLVEIVPLDDDEGPDRLAAFRRFLEIEAVADPVRRLDELRTYLRAAVVSDRSFVRWNAAREYASLAKEVPGALDEADRAPLETARGRAVERPLRALLDAALAECPGRRKSARSAAVPVDARSDALSEFTNRFVAKDAPPAARRQAVIDAAVGLADRAAPLYARALDDPDPTVREAGAAAAGQFRVASLEGKIASMLAGDPSAGVRRTLIVSAGLLASKASVPTLALLAGGDGPSAQDAAFALARVRDDAALRELRRLRAEAAAKDRIEMFDFLLSDRFVEQERALRDGR